MSREAVTLRRRADLESALKRAKPRSEIGLDALATLWGVSKQRFINILRDIEKLFDVPQWRQAGAGQAHLYPARKMLRVLLRYEKRNDAAAARQQEMTSAILGTREKQRACKPDSILPVSELAQLSRIAAETEARERDQGLYCALADQSATAGRVFGLFSDFLSNMAARVDPNGLLPAEVRAVIDAGAHNVGLSLHAEMKAMLSGDAIPQPRRSGRSSSAHGGARRPPARRERG